MSVTQVHLWGRCLTNAQVEYLERLCPVLDGAAQHVAFHWGLDDIKTTVVPKPDPGALSVELRPGVGMAGLEGEHTPSRGIVAWGADSLPAMVLDLPRRISHELWEAMVNPTGEHTFGPLLVEVVDPVSVTPWRVPGPGGWRPCLLSNFVYPSYFGPGGRYPYDHLGVITRPGHPEPGAYQTVNGVLVAGPPRSTPTKETP